MFRCDQQTCVTTLNSADYVHDIAYDYYGTRFAICTSSLRISVYSVAGGTSGGGASDAADAWGPNDMDQGPWTETVRMERAHSGPIWRLSWGHPEYGEPLASCSEDGVVTVWYEGQGAGAGSAGSATATALSRSQASGVFPSWQRQAQLQCGGPVVDVRFAPAPHGPKLAACTADGWVKVFVCVNTLDLRSWDTEALGNLPNKIVSTGTLGSGAASGSTAGALGFCTSASLDWMRGAFGGGADDCLEVLAVAGRGSRLAIWSKSSSRSWQQLTSQEVGDVKDLAWCPNLCRPYELIATCGTGAHLWRLDLPSEPSTDCQLSLLKELVPATDQACPLWRCSWNITGTTLALCPESGEVSVWKCDSSMDWRQECQIDMIT